MTKSDISYASIPTSEGTPYVEGFTIGDSHAVTVIVDETNNNKRRGNNNNPYYENPSETLMNLGRRPVGLSECPCCHQKNVRTSTKTYPNIGTWFGVVATSLCFFPLFWVPLVVDNCKQTDHYCQSCQKKVGTVKPLEGCFVKEMS